MSKLTVSNYEGIAQAEIVIEGITVIVGDTNNCKSSLWRAVETLFYGTPGDGYIKRGTSYCNLGFSSKNRVLLRTKDSGGVSYYLDGAKYDKVGRKSHLDILAPMGIKEFQAQRTIRPNMIGQFDPLFLVSFSPSEAFSVLSLVFEETRLNNVLKNIGIVIRDQNTLLTGLTAVIDSVTAELKGLQDTQKAKSAVFEKLEKELTEAMKEQELLDEQEKSARDYFEIVREIAAQETIVSKSFKLEWSVALNEAAPVVERLPAYEALIRSEKNVKDCDCSTLLEKSAIVRVELGLIEPEVTKLTDMCDMLSKYENSHAGLLSVELNHADTLGVQKTVSSLVLLCEECVEYDKKSADVVRWENSLKALAVDQDTLGTEESTRNLLLLEIAEMDRQFTTCPFCGVALTEESKCHLTNVLKSAS